MFLSKILNYFPTHGDNCPLLARVEYTLPNVPSNSSNLTLSTDAYDTCMEIYRWSWCEQIEIRQILYRYIRRYPLCEQQILRSSGIRICVEINRDEFLWSFQAGRRCHIYVFQCFYPVLFPLQIALSLPNAYPIFIECWWLSTRVIILFSP